MFSTYSKLTAACSLLGPYRVRYEKQKKHWEKGLAENNNVFPMWCVWLIASSFNRTCQDATPPMQSHAPCNMLRVNAQELELVMKWLSSLLCCVELLSHLHHEIDLPEWRTVIAATGWLIQATFDMWLMICFRVQLRQHFNWLHAQVPTASQALGIPIVSQTTRVSGAFWSAKWVPYTSNFGILTDGYCPWICGDYSKTGVFDKTKSKLR
jgi:hypothetical protein